MTDGIIHSKVRGVTFEGRQKIIRQHVKPGMALRAIREPKNPHGNGNTIGLWAGNKQIGYMGSELADEIAPLMDSGQKISVRVSDLTGGGKDESIGVNIVIDMNGGSAMAPAPVYGSPLRKAAIVIGLLLVVLLCGGAQNTVVGIMCLAAAGWLVWQWRRAGGRML